MVEAGSHFPLSPHAFLISENLANAVARGGAQRLVCDACPGAALFSERLVSKPDVTIAPQIGQQAAFYYAHARHLLIATTALVATAGVAAADITLKGMARTGVVKEESTDAIVSSRVQFDLRGSSEVGELTFGGFIRMRSTNGPATTNGGQVSVSGAGMTVFGGNIPGPLDSMANVYGTTVGYTGGTFQGLVVQSDTMAYSSTGAGANAIQANYSMEGLTVKAAYQPGTENSQVVVEYTNAGLTVALGAQFSDDATDEETVATAAYSFGDVSVSVGYSDNNGTVKSTLSGSAKVADGVTVGAYYSDLEGAADNGYGLGISYSLGAGASLGAAYENTFAGTSRVEAGVSFSF
jgi:outer membrane protein OmpU